MRKRFRAPLADRLDKILALGTDLSRRRARALIDRGGVRVDGKVLRRSGDIVPEGAFVEVRTNAAPDVDNLLPERYRDDDLLVVDKPAGLPTQGTRQGHAQHLYGILQAKEGYVGLHHRLDTPASGLLLLTLTRRANPAVARLFAEGLIEREYRVAVLGDPGERGVWDSPIDGQPARTRFKRLGGNGRLSLIACRLETGRTHQIRVHAALAGHPVLGDVRHGGAAGRLWPRLALHAAYLRFEHPATGEPVEVESPIPADLAELFSGEAYGGGLPTPVGGVSEEGDVPGDEGDWDGEDGEAGEEGEE